MKAIVLIKFTSLETKDAYHRVKELEPVIESYMVYGRFDAVAIIQADSLDEIRDVILTDIQTIPGVVETMPCLIVEPAEAEEHQPLVEKGHIPIGQGRTV